MSTHNNLVKMLFFTVMTITLSALPGTQAADNETDENSLLNIQQAGSFITDENSLLNIQQAGSFILSFTGGDQDSRPTGRWWSISGGRPNIEVVTITQGQDPHEQKQPGQVYFADITVKGPFVKDRKAVMDWVNDTASGRRERVDLTLSFLDENGQIESTYALYDALPISYQPPAVSAGNYDLLEKSLTSYALYDALPISYQPPAVSAGNYDLLEESLTFHVDKVRKIDGEVANSKPNPSDEASFGGKFRVTLDEDIPATSFSGGGVTFDKREVTGGERHGTIREYTITKVNWANIVIEKNCVQGDTKWKDWFWEQSKGQIDRKNVTLEYQDSEGRPVRHIDYHNCWPVRYDLMDVDARSGSSSAKEVIECVVEYAVY